MDQTAAQQKVDALTAQVQTDKTALSNDQTALTEAQAELSQITLINQLEALTESEVATINDALANDAQNTSKISLSFPPAPSPAA